MARASPSIRTARAARSISRRPKRSGSAPPVPAGAGAFMVEVEAVLLEIGADHGGQAVIVLDHQDALRHVRTLIPSTWPRSVNCRSVVLGLHMVEQHGPLLRREHVSRVAHRLD